MQGRLTVGGETVFSYAMPWLTGTVDRGGIQGLTWAPSGSYVHDTQELELGRTIQWVSPTASMENAKDCGGAYALPSGLSSCMHDITLQQYGSGLYTYLRNNPR